MLHVIINLWECSELYRYRSMLITYNTDFVHEEHAPIVAACRKCDPVLAQQTAVAYIVHAQRGHHDYLKREKPKANDKDNIHA